MAKCGDYIELIQDIVDNRSSREQEVYLNRHFKLCVKCLDKLNLEIELKKAIRYKVQHLDVPPELADSIRKKISGSL